MINACTLGGALVHGDALQHVRTRFEHRTRVGVRQLEADARTCAGSGRGGSLRQSRYCAEAERRGDRQRPKQP